MQHFCFFLFFIAVAGSSRCSLHCKGCQRDSTGEIFRVRLAMASKVQTSQWPVIRVSWNGAEGAAFSVEVPIPMPPWMQQPVARYEMPYAVVVAGLEEQETRPETARAEVEIPDAAYISSSMPPSTAQGASTASASAMGAQPPATKWLPHAGELRRSPWNTPSAPPPILPTSSHTLNDAQSLPIATEDRASTRVSSQLAALVPAGRGSHARRPQP